MFVCAVCVCDSALLLRSLNGCSERCANHHMARAVVNFLCTELRAKVGWTGLALAAGSPFRAFAPAAAGVPSRVRCLCGRTTRWDLGLCCSCPLSSRASMRRSSASFVSSPTPGRRAEPRRCIQGHPPRARQRGESSDPVPCAAARVAASGRLCAEQSGIGMCRRVLAYAQVLAFCVDEGHDLHTDEVRTAAAAALPLLPTAGSPWLTPSTSEYSEYSLSRRQRLLDRPPRIADRRARVMSECASGLGRRRRTHSSRLRHATPGLRCQ